jgi:UDP:flavonoid glycosyltransferase YjiC (YdhE family)
LLNQYCSMKSKAFDSGMKISDLKWAFFSYGHNLGDFTRALETAKGMQKTGAQVKFFNHGGVHNHLIAQAGIQEHNLYPELSWEQHEVIMDINRYKAKLGTPIPISADDWIAMAEADIKALQEYQPHGVYAGLNLSCMISVPYLKIPMITQVPTVNCPAFIRKGMYNMPNTMEKNFFMRRVLPGFVKRAIMKKVLLSDSAKASLSTFNEARKHFGLKPIYNITELVRGDLTLLPDLPVLSGLSNDDLDPGYIYTGPIFSMMDMPIPEEVAKVFKPSGINVFCTLGSSGFPETLKSIVEALKAESDLNIVCSTTTILDPLELGPNTDRFFATRYLPAHLVNEMADVAVTHGGQGTIQTAVWAGTPVVGVGFQAEQQANIDGIQRAGMAIRIPIYDLSAKKLVKSVRKLSRNPYQIKAKEMQKLVRSVDGVKASVDQMNSYLMSRAD